MGISSNLPLAILVILFISTPILCQNQAIVTQIPSPATPTATPTTPTTQTNTNANANAATNNGMPTPQVVQPIPANLQPVPAAATATAASQPTDNINNIPNAENVSKSEVVNSVEPQVVHVQPIVVDPISVPPIVSEGVPIQPSSLSVQSSQNSVPVQNNNNPNAQKQLNKDPIPTTTSTPASPQVKIPTVPESAQPAAQQQNPSSTHAPNPQQQTPRTSYQINTEIHPNILAQPSPSDAGFQQNFDEPNADRSSRYRAQQQRLAQIRRKQQQFEQQQRHYQQRQNQRVSRTQQTRVKQYKQSIDSNPNHVPLKTVLFQGTQAISQFYLNPIENVQVVLKSKLYVLESDAYGVTKDIDAAPPIRVYVYQDNNRIVGQGEFYFQNGINFKAKAKSTYIIRFYNEGSSSRLIQLQYPDFLEQTHLAHLYPESSKNLHVWKTQILSNRIGEVTQKLRRSSFMDTNNSQTLILNLRKYSIYQFIQMLVVIAVAGFQVRFLKKMFRTESIL